MANYSKNGMDITITLGSTDLKNYSVEVKDYPSNETGDVDFILVEGIADIKFTATKNPSSSKKVKFAKDVEFEVSYPPDAETKIKNKFDKYEKKYPKEKEKLDKVKKLKEKIDKLPNKADGLILAYKIDDQWVKFPNVTGKNGKKKTKFKDWYADPPVGWGFMT